MRGESVNYMKHELKLDKEFFYFVLSGIKTFEIRFNDRNYQVGDVLILKEWDKVTKSYTGRVIEKEITYITDYEQKDGYVVMSIV